MKKLGVLLSLIFLMALSGCISEKTQQKLTTSTGGTTTGGGIEVVTGDYAFKSSEEGTFEPITGSFMEFSYDKTKNKYTGAGGTNFELTPTGEILPYASIKSVEGTTISFSDELKTLVDALVPEGVVTKKNEGGILFSKLNKGTYEKGEITKGSEKYTYILAKITLPLTENTVTKNYTYLVRTVVKNDIGTELSIFENILRTFKAKRPVSAIDLTKQTDLIKNLESLNTLKNYSDETLKQNIYKAIDDFYIYIEGAYIDSSIASNEKRIKVVDYVKSQPLEYKESTINTYKKTDVYGTIVKLLEKTEMTYRDDLEGEIEKAIEFYNQDEKKINRVIGNLAELENKFKALVDNQIKQDSLQKYVYNKEFWRSVVLAEYRTDSLVQEAIDYIIIGNLEDIRVNKLGEGTNPATSGYQPLQSYEEQMIKITEYASYRYYTQDLFLPQNDHGINNQLNIADYLMIKGAEDLKTSATLLGKTCFAKDVYTQRNISEIYKKAYRNIINKKMSIVSLRNKEYFDKIETAKVNGTLLQVDLSAKRIEIQEALDNLSNTVKIYDSGKLSIVLETLKTSTTYELGSAYVLGKIKLVDSSADVVIDSNKEGKSINYQKSIFAIPLTGAYNDDLETLAMSIQNDTIKTRISTGVKTSLDILELEKNN